MNGAMRLAAVALVASIGAQAAAQRQHVDALTVSGQLDDLSAGGSGHGAALDWIRAYTDGDAASLGVASHTLAGSRWRFARAGGALRLRERWTSFGQASLGSGRNASGGFPYRIVAAGVDLRAADGLHLKFDDQYFHVETARGHLPRVTTIWLPSAAWSVEGAYARSVGGNLASTYGSLRVDRTLAAPRLFAGLALGRSRPEVFNVGVGAARSEMDSKQWFAGLALPAGGREWTAVANVIEVGSVRRRTLTLAYKFPLGG